MWKKWTALAVATTSLLVGCENLQASTPLGDRLVEAEELVNAQNASPFLPPLK